MLSSKMINKYYHGNETMTAVMTMIVCIDVETDILRYFSTKGYLLSFNEETVDDLPHIRTGGVMDLNCNFSESVIEKFSKSKSFGVHTEWLMLDYVNSTETLQISDGLLALKDAYIYPSSCVTYAQIADDEIAYYDAYRVSLYRPMKYILMSKQTVFDFEKLPPRSPDRYNLEGIKLTSAFVLYHKNLFTGLESYDSPEIDTIPKANYPIVKVLSEQLNFSFTMMIMDDYGWQTNKTFSGLIGLLQREEIDLGTTGVFMRADRSYAVDFTGDTFEIKSTLIFKQPALSSVSNIFVLPFTLMVWICCLALAILTTVLLIVDASTTVGGRQAFTLVVTPADVTTAIISTVCQQGTEIIPKSGSAKLIIFLFSLSTLFFYTSYSANIVALLQSTSPTIKTITDLTESPLSVGIQDVIYNKIYFEETIEKSIQNLYRKKIVTQGNKAFIRPDVGIEKVRTGLYAFSVESHWGYKIISDTFTESEKCGIDELRLFYLPKMSIPVIKKSGYREIFTVKITLQRDIGLHDRIRLRWLPNKPECDSRGRGYVSVGLTDFKPALFIISYGFAISFLVFLFEVLFSIRNRLLRKCKGKRHRDGWE